MLTYLLTHHLLTTYLLTHLLTDSLTHSLTYLLIYRSQSLPRSESKLDSDTVAAPLPPRSVSFASSTSNASNATGNLVS